MNLIQEARDTYAGWMAAIDKRVVSWPLMANPWPTLAICLAYCIAAYTLPKILEGQGSYQDYLMRTETIQEPTFSLQF